MIGQAHRYPKSKKRTAFVPNRQPADKEDKTASRKCNPTGYAMGCR